jgi:hypothetical protein
MQPILRIDINYLTLGSHVRQIDVDRDCHPRSQAGCRGDQYSTDVDGDNLSLAGPAQIMIL